MARLVMIVDVTNVDPTVMDPHGIGEDACDAYNENADMSSAGNERLLFVSAEWEQ